MAKSVIIPEVFVTKYALSQGIVRFENAEVYDGGISVGVGWSTALFHDKEWYKTLPEAKARAREMVQAKKKSIEKQLKKLDAIAQNPTVVTAKEAGFPVAETE